MGVKASVGAVGAVLLLGLAMGASCGDSERPETPEPVRAERPDPSFRVLVITDLKGYLEPCGCTSRPLGGIDRMAAKVKALSEGTPTALVLAGDLFFDGLDHGGVSAEGAEAQELWKAETLVDTLNGMGLVAATPGRLDLSHGPSVFGSLRERADFPLVAGGWTFAPPPAPEEGTPLEGTPEDGTTQEGDSDPTEPPLPGFVLVERGGKKIGIVGVSVLDQPVGPMPDGVEQPSSPLEVAAASIAAAKAEGAELILALVRGPRRLSRRVAALDDLDFVIQAGVDENDPILPQEGESAHLFHAGRQGQGLVAIDVFLRSDGDFTDWSDWSVEAEREHLTAQISTLERRITEWENDDSVNEDDVRTQRSRLTRLQSELAGVQVQRRVEGNAFNAQYFELDPDADREASVTQAMARYDRRVNAHNQVVFADLVPEPVREGQPHYVGSESCRSCHSEAVDWWRAHPHGRAYQTLVDRHKQFNLSCVGCHVTGYMQPGGSTVTHNLDGALVDVGCESCHGPGSAHVEDPESPDGGIALDAPESLCVTCHNPEHSDTFVYVAYRAMLMAPGHGLPSPSSE